VTGPELEAITVVVDFTQLGALLFVTAAEAVGKSRRLSVVSVVSRDVAAMAAFVRLHTASTVDGARVTVRPQLSAPARRRNIGKRYKYKIAILSYKVLHDTAPRYLGPLTRVADIPGRRALRSASTDRLEVPYFKLSTIGGRAFPVAASQI